MKTIKGELWRIYVSEGAMAMVHGQSFPINEFYIPKYKISFNVVNDHLNIFPSDGRYTANASATKIGDVNIPLAFLRSVKKHMDMTEKLRNEAIQVVMDLGGANE